MVKVRSRGASVVAPRTDGLDCRAVLAMTDGSVVAPRTEEEEAVLMGWIPACAGMTDEDELCSEVGRTEAKELNPVTMEAKKTPMVVNNLVIAGWMKKLMTKMC